MVVVLGAVAILDTAGHCDWSLRRVWLDLDRWQAVQAVQIGVTSFARRLSSFRAKTKFSGVRPS